MWLVVCFVFARVYHIPHGHFRNERGLDSGDGFFSHLLQFVTGYGSLPGSAYELFLRYVDHGLCYVVACRLSYPRERHAVDKIQTLSHVC